MGSSKSFSLPVMTALAKLIEGVWDGNERYGVKVGTHAELDDFFNSIGAEVASQPSIPKKIRATLNWMNSEPVRFDDLKAVVEQIADPRNSGWNHDKTIDHLNQVLGPDGYEVRLVGGKWRMVATGMSAVAATALQSHADALDMQSVQEDFARATDEADTDPADAITSACATVESVCKCILDEMGKEYPSKQDIRSLVGEVAKYLNLSPGRDDLPKEWADDIRMILQGLYTVVGGIGALRTHAGDAHGKGKRSVPVDARIARLAIHAASTVSLFYIETWRRLHPR